MSALTALVLTATVDRLEGCTPEHPLGSKTPLGSCSFVLIGYPDGGTSIHVGKDGVSRYQTELTAPAGGELVAAILAEVAKA